MTASPILALASQPPNEPPNAGLISSGFPDPDDPDGKSMEDRFMRLLARTDPDVVEALKNPMLIAFAGIPSVGFIRDAETAKPEPVTWRDHSEGEVRRAVAFAYARASSIWPNIKPEDLNRDTDEQQYRSETDRVGADVREAQFESDVVYRVLTSLNRGELVRVREFLRTHDREVRPWGPVYRARR